MITDDPGTPGPGKWEINLATAFEHRPSETAADVPAIDLNYGVGERVQLTLQTAPVILKRDGHGAIGGLGGTEAALKWRFLDQENDGLSISIFPRVIFNVLQSSVRRGLAEDGTRAQLPVQVAKKLGIIALDFEFGPVVSTVGRSGWLYGIVGGVELTKTTTVMAELHGTTRMGFARDVLTANIGLRHELSQSVILITSLGHEVRTPDGDPLAFIGYCGVQLLY
ncbi:MAG: hypothetical protein JWO45_2109 [Spartobacteria bacterium]|nr:hypothetical protein [Spartobacteria bacterium]